MDTSENEHSKLHEYAKIMNMTEQEEDIIYRMHKLVGDKWALIAGRIPGRTPEEIRMFWITRNSTGDQKNLTTRCTANPNGSLRNK